MPDAIFQQVKEKQFGAVRAWLQRNAGGVNTADDDGFTILHHLAQADSLGEIPKEDIEELAALLLEAGADVHQPAHSGDTAFNIAAAASPVLGRLMTNHCLTQALQGLGQGLT